jgi:misacylated tRNA(Ala) deacylase
MNTELLFRDDAYARECAATVLAITERGGIVLDRTVFYATGGGQPGDRGWLGGADGSETPIAVAVYSEDKADIVHVPDAGARLPVVGDKVTARLDWDTRFRRMRTHTALHLLTTVLARGDSISTVPKPASTPPA